MTCEICRADHNKRAERDNDPRPLGCDVDGKCTHPGEPGTEGALWVENLELSERWQVYKRLGGWAAESLNGHMTERERVESTHLMYELDIYNEELKRAFTTRDSKGYVTGGTRLIWDME